MTRIAVVTDSTAGLSPDETAELGVYVVPLHVLVDGDVRTEGVDIDTAGVLEQLRRRQSVSTSRPSPAALRVAYEHLAAAGVDEIVSVHLSAQLSGTYEAAVMAARDASVPVHVIDSRSAGSGLGYAVATGSQLVREGASVQQVVEAIERRCAAATVLFYVHSLEQLRRGGRIGAAAGLLGGALAIKPLLALIDGHIEPVEKLRTTSRAVARLIEVAGYAVASAGPDVDVAVHHAGAEERAVQVADALAEILASSGRPPTGDEIADVESTVEFSTPPAGYGQVNRRGVRILNLPAVLTVHLGPGTVAVVVSARS